MADQSTALVIGANKGIGLEIARGLGRAGYRVWIGSRATRRGAAAAGAGSDADSSGTSSTGISSAAP